MIGVTLYQNGYNSVGNVLANPEPLLTRIIMTIQGCADAYVNAPGYVYSSFVPRILNIIILCIGIFELIVIIVKRKKRTEIIFAGILLVLLPLGMNCMRLLNNSVHSLMQYAIWVGSYITVIILLDESHTECQDTSFNQINSLVSGVAVIATAFLLLFNIQVANNAYTEKDIDSKATLSLMTRVIERIELLDGYEPGSTAVVFVGTPTHYTYSNPYLLGMKEITGMENDTPITYEGVYNFYFQYILKRNVLCISSQNEEYTAMAENMPSFPAKDSIQFIDNVVVVKW